MAVIPCSDVAATPPISIGTGVLAYSDGGGYTSVGNVSLVDFQAEGDPFPVFASGVAESPSLAAIHRTWRIRATGDAYTMDNLALLTNGLLQTNPGGGLVSLPWISEPVLRSWQFTRTAPEGLEEIIPTVQITLFRAFLDIPFSYSFSQDEFSYHEFSIVALPDFTNGSPGFPFGVLTFSGAA